MSSKLLKRHVAWSDATTWNTFLADCDIDPGISLSWVEENLSGPWSHRLMSASEYEVEYGQAHEGRFVLVLAIKDNVDADKLYMCFSKPAGSA